MPRFPLNIRDLDLTVDTLDGGSALINKEQRHAIGQSALKHRGGNPTHHAHEVLVGAFQAFREPLQGSQEATSFLVNGPHRP